MAEASNGSASKLTDAKPHESSGSSESEAAASESSSEDSSDEKSANSDTSEKVDDGEDFWRDESEPAGGEKSGNAESTGETVEIELTPAQRLLRLTQRFQFDEANELLKQNTVSAPLQRDERKRTAVHYAAMHSRGQATLKILVDVFGMDCIAEADKDKVTPLHFAAAFHSKNNFALILKQAKPKCLQLRDANGDSCAHWAGRNKRYHDVTLAAVEVLGPECLAWRNAKQRSVLCDALTDCGSQTARKLLEIAGPESLGLRDDEGNTCAHFAADNRRDESVILTVAESVGPKCLAWQNYRKLSVLQKALLDCSVDTAAKLVAIAGADALSLRDEMGNTCLHAVEKNKEAVLLTTLECFGNQCLTWQNGKKQSVLHDAVLNCSAELAEKLVQLASTDCLNLRDEDGNTCLHDAVRSDTKMGVVLAAVQSVGWWCLSWQNNKKQSVLYLAVSACSAASASQLLKMAPAMVLRVDGDGNTLLHSLFQNQKHRHTEKELQEFFSMMTTLVGAGVSLLTENNIGQNCLHGTTMLEKCLSLIVTSSLMRDTTKKMFRQLLRNSSGIHAVHAFSSRYRLREIVKPLAKLSEMQVSDLLRLTVSSDSNKGATCLHFACEAGNTENIRYLMAQGLQLHAVTHSGQTCIDYAYENGKLDEVLEVIDNFPNGISKTDLWRLVDPAQRALKLPDRLNSRQLVASIAHESMKPDALKDECSLVSEDQHDHNRRPSIESCHDNHDKVIKKEVNHTDVDVLIRALELDSPRILRSALSLNLVTKETERFLQTYLIQKMQSEKYDSQRFFQNADEFLQQKPMHMLSEISIIDVAAFFDKAAILPDFILTRQFELIPACISLLVYLKPKLARTQGKDEHLMQLQSKITCIVVNALDVLYVSASEDKKSLLVDYIRGDLRDNDGQNPGPLFPCRCEEDSGGNPTYHTLVDMIEEANCSDLIETDCLHQVARRAWYSRPQSSTEGTRGKLQVNRITPRAKFYIHHVAFIIFLAYSAWYTIDFRATFRTPFPDIILALYAASFTVQEAVEFSRSRTMRNVNLGKRMVRCPTYFADAVNWFDCLSLLLLWIGLVWKWVIFYNSAASSTTYACQMLFTTSFMLWGFRSVAFLSYHEKTGPLISMLKSLLILDLLPFLAILIVIFYVFGVFFFNLLFSVVTATESEIQQTLYGWNVALQVFTLPFNLLFTNFDKVHFESNAANQSIGKVPNAVGLSWFTNLMLFMFLILVNLVMMNLLIAQFSLRVSRMDSRAMGIWRRTYFGMLREYESIGPVPPPLSFISEIVFAIVRSIGWKRVEPTQKNEWWLNESDYPDEYVRFLKFQAARFRRARPQLAREVTRNRSDIDGLKAHTGNLLETLEERIDGRVETLAERQDECTHKLSGSLELVEKRLGDRLQQLEAQKADGDSLQNPQMQTTIVDVTMMKSLEAKLSEEIQSIRELVSPRPDQQREEQVLADREEVDASRFRRTERRLRRQRKRIQKLDLKMDTIIELLRQQHAT